MKSQPVLTAAIAAGFIIATSQIPSQALLPGQFQAAAQMTSVQIKSMSTAIETAFSDAMAHATTTSTATGTTGRASVKASGRYKCASGGYIDTSYTMTTVADTAAKTATLSASGKQLLKDWRCVKGWTVNGDPYISHTLTGSVVAEKTSMNAGMGGGWKAVGPNKAKQACQFRGTIQYASDGKSGSTIIRITCKPGGITNITERF